MTLTDLQPWPPPRKWPVKGLLLIFYLILAAPVIGARVEKLGASPALIAFGMLFGALTLALLFVSRLRDGRIRWPIAVILFASAAYMSGNEAVSGQHFSYESHLNMLGAAAFAGDALSQHGDALAVSVLLSLPLLPAIGLAPRGRGMGAAWGLGLPLAILIGFTAILFARGGEGARGVPTAWPPIAYSLLHAVEVALAPSRVPRSVDIVPGNRPARGDIVLIIDESMAPNYLDINAPTGVRSGLIDPPTGIAVHNFGIAAAITHCSLGTNLTLRHGGMRDSYAEHAASGPTIWQYAKAAGYRTVYIDGQRSGGAYQNGMDRTEARDIDAFVQFGNVPVVDRDHAIARRLSELLADDRRDFILVNKVGAHFPVQDKYPVHAERYRPTSPRGRFAGITDIAVRDQIGDTRESWRRYRNAYRNTVEWNVGGFFDRLFAGGIGDATVIYTADHGQDLNERPRAGASTHCTGNPSAAEGAVPLAVIAGAGAGDTDWAAAAARNANRASHYQLFATLLAQMGYPGSAIRAEHGVGLGDPLTDELRFNTLYNARLGRDPEWRRVDPRTLPHPPAGDFVVR